MYNVATFDTLLFNGSASASIMAADSAIATDAALVNHASLVRGDTASANEGAIVTTSGGGVNTTANSSVGNSTQTPASRGSLISLTDGNVVLIYQAGSHGVTGLAMKLSGNRGFSFGSEIAITTSSSVPQTLYPSAIAQRDTNDIHLVYSLDDGTGTIGANNSIYYKRLIYTGTPGNPSFNQGTELVLMSGSFAQGFARASIGLDANNVPFALATRSSATGTTIACAVGATVGNLAGAAIVNNAVGLNILSPDVSIATSALGGKWFAIIQSGGSVWLTKADPSVTQSGTNAGQQSITFVSLTSWSADTVHTISAEGGPETTGDSHIHLAWIKNGNAYETSWDETTQVLEPANFLVANALRVFISHDGFYGWAFIITKVSSTYTALLCQEQFNWAPTILDTTGSETWDWPTSVARLDDVQSIIWAWCTSGLSPNKIYTFVSNFSIPKRVQDFLTALDLGKNIRPAADYMYATDFAKPTIQAKDGNFSLQDFASYIINPKAHDFATASDTSSKISQVIDSGLATELVRIALNTQTDALSATDAALYKQQIVGADSVSGADAYKLYPKTSDSGLATDLVPRLIRAVNDQINAAQDSAKITFNLGDGSLNPASDAIKLTIDTADGSLAPALDAIAARKIQVLDASMAVDLIATLNRTLADGLSQPAQDAAKSSYLLADALSALDAANEVPREQLVLLRLFLTSTYVKLRTEGYS